VHSVVRGEPFVNVATTVATIKAAAGGDSDVFALIVRGKTSELFAVAYRVLRDYELAEDAGQQAFMNPWHELPQLRDVARFDAWLYRLLLNAAFHEARGRGRHRVPIGTLRRTPGRASSPTTRPTAERSCAFSTRSDSDRRWDVAQLTLADS
jgi:DNA-directed RNA polymerase specialized sigma24 family protein